ncbi:hypothetical protein QFC19_006666 [Naganishia cerealis]|uniref:Uncharacterized protein n=1 Tax=Naganishia cerealis TaxID=610337 RepID=A0ACC2VF91_9TREE|nr:hypothetical protein QFC19_006666 [Naganishia cerealis]
MSTIDIESGGRSQGWRSWAAFPRQLVASRTTQRLLKVFAIATACLFGLNFWMGVPLHHGHLHGYSGDLEFGEMHRPSSSLWDWINFTQWQIPFLSLNAHEQRIKATINSYNLAPEDPLPYQLPPANKIMPDVETTNLPYPASHQRFPSERLRELYPAGPPDDDFDYEEKVVDPRTPIHPFIKAWTSPEWFHPDGRNKEELPKVQWDFAKNRIGRKRRKLNDARKEAVKRAFVYSWQKYKDHAWGMFSST